MISSNLSLSIIFFIPWWNLLIIIILDSYHLYVWMKLVWHFLYVQPFFAFIIKAFSRLIKWVREFSLFFLYFGSFCEKVILKITHQKTYLSGVFLEKKILFFPNQVIWCPLWNLVIIPRQGTISPVILGRIWTQLEKIFQENFPSWSTTCMNAY